MTRMVCSKSLLPRFGVGPFATSLLAFATILLPCAPQLCAQETPSPQTPSLPTPSLQTPPPQTPSQQLPAGIGSIEGDNIEVKTPVGKGIESHFAPTVVASGSEVTLSDGNGRILLDDGGEISICGPAHFTLFKSGDAVTLALDYGRVHPSIDAAANLTIFTPIVVATPIAIAGAHRNTTIGLDQHGAMCVLTDQGAMRIQQQLSDQSLVIPQGNSANLVDGQVESLHADAGSCSCQYTRPVAEVPADTAGKEEAVTLPPSINPPLPPKHTDSSAVAVPPAETPVYTVDLPPLSFDKSAPAPPPDPSPESLMLVREVQVEPDVEYHGHINPVAIAEIPAASGIATPVAQSTESTKAIPAATRTGLLAHLRNFFRSLGGHPPCEGSGCGRQSQAPVSIN